MRTIVLIVAEIASELGHALQQRNVVMPRRRTGATSTRSATPEYDQTSEPVAVV